MSTRSGAKHSSFIRHLEGKNMVFFVLLMLLVNQGFINGDKVELKANVGKCLVVGETLELNCSITNWNEISDPDLNQLNIEHSSKKRRFVNHSVIDNRTVQAIISNMEKGDGGYYRCSYKPDPNLIMDLLFEVTDPDPMPADIDCIANGAATQVDCTWSRRDLCATWRLFYSQTGDRETACVLPVHNLQKSCAEHTIDSSKRINTRCHQLPTEGKPLQLRCSVNVFFGTNFSLRLERNNPSGIERRTFQKRFDDTIVKLDAVQNLLVHSSSTAMSLDWKFLKSPRYYNNGIRCNVSCGMETKTLIFPENDTNKDVRGILFNNLHPFTEYNITVICKVTVSRYWGDPIERAYQTEEDIPLVGPHATDTSYTLAGCISESSGTCSLTIYTEQEDTLNTNGNITGYAVEIRSRQEPKLKQRFNFSNSRTTLEIGPLDKGIIPPFNVSIWSKTSKGLSNRSTDIIIKPNKDIAFQALVVEEQDASYLITAEILSSSSSSEFICHWCYGLKTDNKITCKGGYGYRNSSKPEFFMEKSELDESGVEDDNNYRWYFGMSVSTEAGSTGIHWEDCIFRSTKHVQSPPKPEMPVLSDGIRNQIVVLVQAFCPPVNSNSGSLRPMNYTVVCTNNDDFRDERTKTFEARYNDNRLEINDLKPGSTYNVKYNIGYRQSTSPYSEPASKYISAQPQIELIVGLAVGITFVLLFGILMIWKLAKWYNKIEQPIEGVEIRNSNWGNSNIDPTDCHDDMCVESSEVEDVTHNIVAECNNGHDYLHQASKIFGNRPDSKHYKLATRNCSDIFNPHYEIIGSITSGADIDVRISGSDRFEHIVAIDDEMCSNKSFASEDTLNIVDEQTADAIDMFHQSTKSSDVTINATAARTEKSADGESGIYNHLLTTRSVYSENSDDADNTPGSPKFTEYMPMNDGCCQRVSEVMLDEQDSAVTLPSATEREAIDDEDDSSQQHIEDFLVMQPNSLLCVDQPFPSRQNKSIKKSEMSEKSHPTFSGYKRLPQAETYPVFRPNIGHEMFDTFETDDEPCTSDADIELHVPTVPFPLIETGDTQQLDTTMKLDETSRKSTNQMCVLGRITKPSVENAGSQKPAKTHYQTLPCF
ncbi:uncharacterized protein LOC110449533 [Mizuhopecten yessoensis]|uniref:Fibronectin type-III domain-containing protein n=1 Tax=Mizuhopecten yessoensis TaxID=6573 RepID=A0A210QR23_MIZYE|nr:uncharacterized protein LOC110449533 [Mizuhopecten yessoensis]OWF51173.1 hypothetical protein KP79_PYT12317 [Mizuhopecten yessoensis]